MTPQRHKLLDFLNDHFRNNAVPVIDAIGGEWDAPETTGEIPVLSESCMIYLASQLEQFLLKEEAESIESDTVERLLSEVRDKISEMDHNYAVQLLRLINLALLVVKR